ncbi:hypothetical protein BDD12DRAFT_819276 [Trichophaea hybrida]|nr:hypothetical protein BDD12DRAFT_819276 [Trichophaea hybrida]
MLYLIQWGVQLRRRILWGCLALSQILRVCNPEHRRFINHINLDGIRRSGDGFAAAAAAYHNSRALQLAYQCYQAQAKPKEDEPGSMDVRDMGNSTY